MNILLVDDSDLDRQLVRETIERLGHKAIGEASDGMLALKLYESKQPDLVFMDIDMPEMNGFDIIKLMLEMDPKAKIVVITGLNLDQEEVLKSGALGMMKKPLRGPNLEQMLRQVMAALAKKGSRPTQITRLVDDSK